MQLVLRKIELKQSEAACPEGDGEGDDADEVASSGSNCAELQVGPVLVNLPLDAGAQQAFTVNVSAGTYDRITSKLHRPTGDPEDSALLAANPVLQEHRTSVRVAGTYNGTRFVYYTDAVAAQRISLSPPLVVRDGAPTQLTLFADVNT